MLKLYDSDIREFKLQELVTFVGILEYQKPSPVADSQMTDLQAGEDFAQGIPNEATLPHLHVICHERNYVTKNLKQMPESEI